MNADILERNVCAAVARAISAAPAGMARAPVVRGAWGDAGNAERGPELKPVGVVVTVAVNPPSFERFELNKATFSCAVEAAFDNASRSAALSTVGPTCAAISRLLFGWTTDRDALARDLAAPGLSPFAALATGGSAPAYDPAANKWRVSFSFSVTALVAAAP